MNTTLVNEIVKMLGQLNPDEVQEILQDVINELGYTLVIN